MGIKKIIGVVLFVLGVSLVTLAYHSNDSTGEKLKKQLLGREKKSNKKELVGGIVLIAVGAGVFIFCGKKKKK